MIDFHTHVLPGMDDGSRNTDMSIKMLQMMKNDGIDLVIATPHFYGEKESIDSFLKRRDVCLDHLNRKYTSDLPKLKIGAEVAFFSGISNAKGLEKLCIQGTKILLLEMPFSNWDKKIYMEVQKLSRSSMHIILAHVERYKAFQSRDSYYDEVLALPCTHQCNASPLLSWKRSGQVIKFFKSGQAQLLGSDCHNLDERSPNLLSGRQVLEKKLGKSVLDTIDEFGSSLLEEYKIHE